MISTTVNSRLPSQAGPTIEPIENNKNAFKYAKVVFITPFYLAAYVPETIAVVCLKVVGFIVSSVNVFNFRPLSYVSHKIEGCAQSLNRAIEWLSPWQIVQRYKVADQMNGPQVLKSNVPPAPTSKPNATHTSTSKEQEVKGISLKTIGLTTIVGIAILAGVLYQTNALHGITSYFDSVPSVSSCLSNHEIPQTFEAAKRVLACNTPFDSLPDWSATKKILRSMLAVFHPDKGGDSKSFRVVEGAKSILEKAFTTESGQREVKIYECIAKITEPGIYPSISSARKIFECANISSSQGCGALQEATNRVLSQVIWTGKCAVEQLVFAYNRLCWKAN